jgi:hypothetical protein
LSRQNPYYSAGKKFAGIGWVLLLAFLFDTFCLILPVFRGPHVDAWHPW